VKFIPTKLAGVIIVEPKVFRDARGFFVETYRADQYALGGIGGPFVQDNQSRSVSGTIRGLHAQRYHPQDKLVRALAGRVFDVVVDIRPDSTTYKEWVAVELSAENFRQIYVPRGFAHGVCVLSEFAEIEYKCSDFYDPDDEIRIMWNDRAIGIEWPIANPVLSAKDRDARPLAEQLGLLPSVQD